MLKPIGFFFAVFLSMLAVFLVATGEVGRWFAPRPGARILVSLDPGKKIGSDKNMLDFDFWDVQQGRRKFTIRAQLNQDTLQGTSRIDDIQEISLKDGIIGIPIYDGGDLAVADETAENYEPEEVLLNFKSAIYHRQGGLARGSGRLEVLLEDGSGKASDGSEFVFEKLLFFNEPDSEDTGRFHLSSDRPVAITNPQLRVESPTGLKGVLSDRGGFEYFVLQPPVYTYLKPEVAGLFGLRRASPSSDGEETTDRNDANDSLVGSHVAITSEGPLELFLRPEERSPSEEPPQPELKRITFSKNVLVYQISKAASGAPPPPDRNWFHCQRLELEILDSPQGPQPYSAVATWDGGRVQAHVAHRDNDYILDGERLEWVRKTPPPLSDRERSAAPALSEALLTGSPRLKGENVDLQAERARLLLEENRVVLEKVSGNLLVASDGAQRPEQKRNFAREIFGGDRDVTQNDGNSAWPKDDGTPAPSDGSSRGGGPLARVLDFQADETAIHFTSPEGSGTQELSHFVARGEEARGVVIKSRAPSGSSEEDAGTSEDVLEAAGKTLTYIDDEKLVTLEGTEQVAPRLSRGRSWVEANKIHLSLEGGIAWFEEEVRAHLEGVETDELVQHGSQGPDGKEGVSSPLELAAHFLALGFREGKTLQIARARGTPTTPARLSTLTGSRNRFLAAEMYLDVERKVIDLFGADPSSEHDQLARMEFENGETEASRIRFERESWKCYLLDRARVRFYSGAERSRKPDLEVLADKAEVTFVPGFRLSSTSRTSRSGVIDVLSSFQSLHAWSTENHSLNVNGKNFLMSGEEATWDSEKEELRFFGRKLQEIELTHNQLRGPVRSREIVYDPRRRLLSLRGSVNGTLRQEGYETQSKSPGNTARRPLVWEFETSALDVQLTEKDTVEADGSLDLVSLRARDKVVLWNASDGVKLRGDDLVYDHASRTVRVFSEDGRPQTLTHFKEPRKTRVLPGPVVTEPPETSSSVDKIQAQEIWVRLYEDASTTEPRAEKRVILVAFRQEVIASFAMGADSLQDYGADKADIWKLHTTELTLHLNPAVDPRSPQMVPWAYAKGNVVFTAGPVQATGDHAEYQETFRRLTLVGSSGRPASLVNTSENLSLSAPAVSLLKRGQRIVCNELATPPAPTLPWPGLPELPSE